MSDQPGIPESVRAAISVPDLVPSPLGDLHFFDGVPALESVNTIYDLLDLVRGIEVYLNTIPGASLVAMRKGFRSVGVDGAGVLGITAPRANSAASSSPRTPRPLWVNVPGPGSGRADGHREPAELAVRARRFLVPLRRRPGPGWPG